MTKASDYVTRLVSDAKQLGLNLQPEIAQKMLSFLEDVLKWTKTYNLTSITDFDEAYTKHILDSLSVAPYVVPGRVLDVGTGAGFPGIPLSLLYPDQHFTLADSNSKKIRFINHFVIMNALKNVAPVHSRAENLPAQTLYSTILCRAFSDIASTIRLVDHLLAPDGQYLFMKGPHFENELDGLPPHVKPEILKIEVPGLDAERYIIRVTH